MYGLVQNENERPLLKNCFELKKFKRRMAEHKTKHGALVSADPCMTGLHTLKLPLPGWFHCVFPPDFVLVSSLLLSQSLVTTIHHIG